MAKMKSIKRRPQWEAGACALAFFIFNGPFVHVAETNFWAERNRSARRANSPLPLASSPENAEERSGSVPPPPAGHSASVPVGILEDRTFLLDSLSPAYGTVRRVFPGVRCSPRSPVVIYIQDVHGNSEAQWNIREGVRSLLNTGRVDLVGLEGTSKEIHLQPFSDYPNEKAVRLAADFLLRENHISGPIHAAMTARIVLPRILGVEDPLLYEANVRAYQEAAPRLEETRKRLRWTRAALEKRKKRFFSPALLEWDSRVQSYRDGKIPLGEYVRGMGRSARGDMLETYLQVLALEKGLNLGKVESERSKLMLRLAATLTEEQATALNKKCLAFRTNQIRGADFYAFLRDLCGVRGISLTDFPALNNYARYVLLADTIDVEKLSEQTAAVEKEAFAQLARTPPERDLIARSRRLWLEEKLANFSLTPMEWMEYESYSPGEKGEDLSACEAFYRRAQARNETMAANLLEAIRNLPEGGTARSPVAILVTGGFHGEGLTRRLTEGGATVVSYVPRIDRIDTAQGSNALGIFTREKTPLDKIFAGERLFLASNPWPKGTEEMRAPAVVVGTAALLRGWSETIPSSYETLGGKGNLMPDLSETEGVAARVKLGLTELCLRVTGTPDYVTTAQFSVGKGPSLSLSPGAWAIFWKMTGLEPPSTAAHAALGFGLFAMLEGALACALGAGTGNPALAVSLWVILNLVVHSLGTFQWNSSYRVWEILPFHWGVAKREPAGASLESFIIANAVSAFSLPGLLLAASGAGFWTSLLPAILPHLVLSLAFAWVRSPGAGRRSPFVSSVYNALAGVAMLYGVAIVSPWGGQVLVVPGPSPTNSSHAGSHPKLLEDKKTPADPFRGPGLTVVESEEPWIRMPGPAENVAQWKRSVLEQLVNHLLKDFGPRAWDGTPVPESLNPERVSDYLNQHTVLGPDLVSPERRSQLNVRSYMMALGALLAEGSEARAPLSVPLLRRLAEMYLPVGHDRIQVALTSPANLEDLHRRSSAAKRVWKLNVLARGDRNDLSPFSGERPLGGEPRRENKELIESVMAALRDLEADSRVQPPYDLRGFMNALPDLLRKSVLIEVESPTPLLFAGFRSHIAGPMDVDPPRFRIYIPRQFLADFSIESPEDRGELAAYLLHQFQWMFLYTQLHESKKLPEEIHKRLLVHTLGLFQGIPRSLSDSRKVHRRLLRHLRRQIVQEAEWVVPLYLKTLKEFQKGMEVLQTNGEEDRSIRRTRLVYLKDLAGSLGHYARLLGDGLSSDDFLRETDALDGLIDKNESGLSPVGVAIDEPVSEEEPTKDSVVPNRFPVENSSLPVDEADLAWERGVSEKILSFALSVAILLAVCGAPMESVLVAEAVWVFMIGASLYFAPFGSGLTQPLSVPSEPRIEASAVVSPIDLPLLVRALQGVSITHTHPHFDHLRRKASHFFTALTGLNISGEGLLAAWEFCVSSADDLKKGGGDNFRWLQSASAGLGALRDKDRAAGFVVDQILNHFHKTSPDLRRSLFVDARQLLDAVDLPNAVPILALAFRRAVDRGEVSFGVRVTDHPGAKHPVLHLTTPTDRPAVLEKPIFDPLSVPLLRVAFQTGEGYNASDKGHRDLLAKAIAATYGPAIVPHLLARLRGEAAEDESSDPMERDAPFFNPAPSFVSLSGPEKFPMEFSVGPLGFALGRLGVVPPLVEALKEKDYLVWHWVALALRISPAKDRRAAVPALLDALEEAGKFSAPEINDIRRHTVFQIGTALLRLGIRAENTPRLLALLQNTSDGLVLDWANTLIQKYPPPLLQLWPFVSHPLRFAFAEPPVYGPTLRSYGSRLAMCLPTLLRHLRSNQVSLVGFACKALPDLAREEPHVLDEIIQAYSNLPPGSRSDWVQLLYDIGPFAVEEAARRIEDRSIFVPPVASGKGSPSVSIPLAPGAWAILWKLAQLGSFVTPNRAPLAFGVLAVIEGVFAYAVGAVTANPVLALLLWVPLNLFMHTLGTFQWDPPARVWKMIPFHRGLLGNHKWGFRIANIVSASSLPGLLLAAAGAGPWLSLSMAILPHLLMSLVIAGSQPGKRVGLNHFQLPTVVSLDVERAFAADSSRSPMASGTVHPIDDRSIPLSSKGLQSSWRVADLLDRQL